jgi:hypothetical protein
MFPYENTCEDLFVKWSEYMMNNLLSLQENLLGCILEMPGKLTFL